MATAPIRKRKRQAGPRSKPNPTPRIDKSCLFDTYTRDELMRLRDEEAEKWRAKSAESSKRKKLRP